MKKYILMGCLFGLTNANAFNMAYVEVNSNRLENSGCYIKSNDHQPFFTMASVFAANINGQSPNSPEIYLNNQVSETLKSSQVKNLQAKGIKVLVTLLGNHQNAGWACMTDATAAKKFANNVVQFVKKYQLDGIDIDDEYSACATNNYSMIMIAEAIKENPEFSGKILSKALFADDNYFTANYNGHKLSEYLDYGWEMTYSSSNFNSRLNHYLKNGMKMDQLMIGGWASQTYPDPFEIGKFSSSNKTAGTMVYDITKNSHRYLSQIQNGSDNKHSSVEIAPNCLS